MTRRSPRSCEELYAREIPDARGHGVPRPPIQGLGNAGGFKLQVEQRGFVDLSELQTETDKLVKAGNDDPRLEDLFSIYRAHAPQIDLDIDRTKCESLKVDVQEAFNTLQVYMGGYFVNLFNKFGRTWQVNLLADEKFRDQPEKVGNLKVRNKLGDMVPLGTLTDVQARRAGRSWSCDTTCTPRRRSTATRPRASARARPSRSSANWRSNRGWPTNGRKSSICSSRKGAAASWPSGWGRCASSWSWRPSTKAGGCRFPSFWSCRCVCSARSSAC